MSLIALLGVLGFFCITCGCPILARIIMCHVTEVISGNGHAYRGPVINYNEPFWEQKPASCRSSSRDSIIIGFERGAARYRHLICCLHSCKKNGLTAGIHIRENIWGAN